MNRADISAYPPIDDDDTFVTRAYADLSSTVRIVKWVSCKKTIDGHYALYQMTASPDAPADIATDSIPCKVTESLKEALTFAATFEESSAALGHSPVGRTAENLGDFYMRHYGARYHFSFGTDGMPQCQARNIFLCRAYTHNGRVYYSLCHKTDDTYILEHTSQDIKNPADTRIEYEKTNNEILDLLYSIRTIEPSDPQIRLDLTKEKAIPYFADYMRERNIKFYNIFPDLNEKPLFLTKLFSGYIVHVGQTRECLACIKRDGKYYIQKYSINSSDYIHEHLYRKPHTLLEALEIFSRYENSFTPSWATTYNLPEDIPHYSDYAAARGIVLDNGKAYPNLEAYVKARFPRPEYELLGLSRLFCRAGDKPGNREYRWAAVYKQKFLLSEDFFCEEIRSTNSTTTIPKQHKTLQKAFTNAHEFENEKLRADSGWTAVPDEKMGDLAGLHISLSSPQKSGAIGKFFQKFKSINQNKPRI